MMKLWYLLKKICKRKFMVLLFLSFFLLPLKTLAISEEYHDVISDIVNVSSDDGKIHLYLFRGEGCPHCALEEQWISEIQEDYQDYLSVYEFEVWYDADNALLLEQVKLELGSTARGVPFTVIGDTYFSGFSETTASQMENLIREYAFLDSDSNMAVLPILGKVNMTLVSIPVVAVILGFIDGFNPCAMWILLLLINLFLGTNHKKKSWVLGFTFLFVSALVYFLSMLGINFILGITAIQYLKVLIGIFIFMAGIMNFKKYFQMRREAVGCTVVGDKKRKHFIVKMRKIIGSKSNIFSLVGIILLAISVNFIELACSLGFPMIFTEILSLNDITGVMRVIYLLIYIFFYMLDDMVVFVVSMITLQVTGITNKYHKLCTLVSALIMIIMGLLLLLKPEWLMFNF